MFKTSPSVKNPDYQLSGQGVHVQIPDKLEFQTLTENMYLILSSLLTKYIFCTVSHFNRHSTFKNNLLVMFFLFIILRLNKKLTTPDRP